MLVKISLKFQRLKSSIKDTLIFRKFVSLHTTWTIFLRETFSTSEATNFTLIYLILYLSISFKFLKFWIKTCWTEITTFCQFIINAKLLTSWNKINICDTPKWLKQKSCESYFNFISFEGFVINFKTEFISGNWLTIAINNFYIFIL